VAPYPERRLRSARAARPEARRSALVGSGITVKVKSEQSQRSMGKARFLVKFGDGERPMPSRNVIKTGLAR
jgi:hypothetical protein